MNDATNSAPPRAAVIHPPSRGRACWLLGDLYVVKLAAADTQGRLSLLECTIWPGHGSPPHIHDDADESFYILEGQFNLRVGEQTVQAGPGAFVSIPRGMVHCYQNVGDTPGRFLVTLAPAGFEKMFEDLGVPATQHTIPPAVDESEIPRLVASAGKYRMRLV